MGERYLLDSNTVIDYIARFYSAKAVRWLNNLIDEEINVSVITKIEVLSYDPNNDDNYQVLIDFFDVSNIFELSDDIVNKTIELRQKQKIKLPDAVIAATSLCNNFILITRNIKDFKNIKGLRIINPYDL